VRAPDDERLARLDLSVLSEPNDLGVLALVSRHGAVDALARVLSAGPESRFADRLGEERGAHLLDRAERLGARYVVPGDLEWPSQLGDLQLSAGGGHPRAVPPLGLWVRGPHDLRTSVLRSAAVVGSRAASGYGVRTAVELAAGLADRGWASVSGAAYGIDSAAHRGSLAAGGVTVAVLACGIDMAYPRGHQGLLDRIGQEGLVVAELPPGAHPTRSRFLDRNRLIAALSPGTVVVEAAFRSGAANTTMWARRMGRRVLGVPGPVDSPLSAGVHAQIRDQGATLVCGPGEVVAELGTLGDALGEVPAESGRDAAARRAAARPHDGLGPLELRALDALGLGSWTSVSEVARRSALSREQVRAALARLVDRGLATRQGQTWRAAEPAPR
jgi:DNA processing protein